MEMTTRRVADRNELSRLSASQTGRGALRVIITVGVLATLALPSRAAEKLPANPKLVHRQIAAGYTLGQEAARREKTFLLCLPDKTVCISRAAIGWRKPFIVSRAGGTAPGFDVFDTSSGKPAGEGMTYWKLPSYLKNIPLHHPAVAWEKLSPTRPLW